MKVTEGLRDRSNWGKGPWDNETPMVVDVAAIRSAVVEHSTCRQLAAGTAGALHGAVLLELSNLESNARPDEAPALRAEVDNLRHQLNRALDDLESCSEALEAERAAHEATREVCREAAELIDKAIVLGEVKTGGATEEALEDAHAALREAAEPQEVRTDRAPIVTPK